MAVARCIVLLITQSPYLWFTTIFLHQTLFFELSHAAPNPPRGTVLVSDWSNYNHQEPEGQGTYAFGYDVEDPETNNVQFRSEERHANGSVTGSYGYLEPDGNIHMVHYIADDEGYRATVENSARGGMLKPIPVLQDINYFAYGYSPQMLAAMKSQQTYKEQKVHEQRERPFDQLSEEQKLHFRPNSIEKEKSASAQQQSNVLQPFTKQLPSIYPNFIYDHLGNNRKVKDHFDILGFV